MKQLLNKILLQDCFVFLARIPPRKIDLAVIDPPYNMGKGKWDSFKSHHAFIEFTERWIDALLPAMKDTGSIYIFNSPFNSAFIMRMLMDRGAHFRNWITWYKRDGISAPKRQYAGNQETILFFTMGREYHFDRDIIRELYLSHDRICHAQKKGILKNGKRWFPNPKGRLCTDVWEFSSHRHRTKVNGKVIRSEHPTPKPEDMIRRMILASSRPNDIVLDLFSGTGTTALACKKLGRRFTGCESNKEFHAILQKRIRYVRRESN